MTSEINDQIRPDTAESTDGAKLGEQVGDDTLPGTVGFPPTTVAGAGRADSPQDASHRDSVNERADRENPETSQKSHEAVRLLDPNATGKPDVEPQLVADDVPTVGLISPEEAAMHLENDQQGG